MIKILFSGEGGQGIQAMAEILALSAFSEGKQVSLIPNFGVEQRGGVSLAFVIIDTQPIAYPKFDQADYLVILADRAVERVKKYQSPKTIIITGKAGRGSNMTALGKLNRLAKIVSPENLIEAMNQRFTKQFLKNPQLAKQDLEAIKG